ncbi:MAG TPA: hypothetical protein VJN21_14785 [Candidatus Acidoferrales bacterium]|nr:hypothetical protein [Candidatus Acidoferrales bacterium]
MGIFHFVLAVLISGFLASFTDWFFGGYLFHKQYLAYPEIWRNKPGDNAGENRAILWSVILGFVTCAAFICACIAFRIHGYIAATHLALFVWVSAPVPLLITNALFIKMHPLNVVSNSLGWLAKLILPALAVGFFAK